MNAAGNAPPTAVDDSVSTDENTPVNINVLLANGGGVDSDPTGDALTPVSHTDPDNGVVTLKTDGTFLYTPDTNFNGQDSFVYTISDGNGGTDTATGEFICCFKYTNVHTLDSVVCTYSAIIFILIV